MKKTVVTRGMKIKNKRNFFVNVFMTCFFVIGVPLLFGLSYLLLELPKFYSPFEVDYISWNDIQWAIGELGIILLSFFTTFSIMYFIEHFTPITKDLSRSIY